jgi:hypothetical protein
MTNTKKTRKKNWLLIGRWGGRGNNDDDMIDGARV